MSEQDSELQQGAEAPEAPETPAAGSAPAGGGEETPSENAQDQASPQVPKGVTEAINRQHFKYQEEKRRADALEQRLSELEAQQQPAARPTIPPIPDPYDDNYEALVAERDRAIQDAAAYDARQQTLLEQRTAAEAQQALQAQWEQQEQAQKFYQRGTKSGLTESEINASFQTVAAWGGVGNELAQFIMGHEQGPQIAKHLAENPQEITQLQTLGAIQGGIYLNSSVIPKLATSAPAGPPPPPDDLGGGGAPPPDDGPPGAKYE